MHRTVVNNLVKESVWVAGPPQNGGSVLSLVYQERQP